MFFRRVRPHVPSFEERIEATRQAGFAAESRGTFLQLTRGDFSADITGGGTDAPVVGRAGMLVGAEIAELVDGGYQKFWMTPGGKRLPALAEQLEALHAFEGDLKQALGLESLYNEALGTTFDSHRYDRVRDRDTDAPRRPWEKQL